MNTKKVLITAVSAVFVFGYAYARVASFNNDSAFDSQMGNDSCNPQPNPNPQPNNPSG